MMTKEDLRAAREKLGLSRTEFGAYLGVSHACITQWEQGRRGISMDSILLRYAIARAEDALAEGGRLPDWRAALAKMDLRRLHTMTDAAAVEV